MKINDILSSFNRVLDSYRGNQSFEPFLVSTITVNKKIGAIKEFIIKIYLVEKSKDKRQLILSRTHVCNCKEEDKEKVLNQQSLVILSDLILLFSLYGKDMALGIYKSPIDNGTK